MIVGVPQELSAGETRVSMVPAVLGDILKAGLAVTVQAGAGAGSSYTDNEYREKGADIAPDRKSLFAQADIILQLHGLGANPERGRIDLDLVHKGQVLIGYHEVLAQPRCAQEFAERGVTILALDLLPRISRAQAMDVMSSMATMAGYKAVIMAAEALPRVFPMMMTAAGTLSPARVLVLGAGVAGLQAIATAKRLGGTVSASDIRPAVKEQVESLGARFLDLGMGGKPTEDKSGYAKEMDTDFYKRQRELLGKAVAQSDVVITTAAIPGRRAPILVTADMVKAMPPGSVIVDVSAEGGGNCELTKPGERVMVDNVTIIGEVNLAHTVPYHASQMYARNIRTFLLHHCKDGKLNLNREDEITRETLVVLDGEIVHPRLREKLGMGPLPK